MLGWVRLGLFLNHTKMLLLFGSFMPLWCGFATRCNGSFSG